MDEIDGDEVKQKGQVFRSNPVFTVPATKAYSKESGADYVVDPSLVSSPHPTPPHPFRHGMTDGGPFDDQSGRITWLRYR